MCVCVCACLFVIVCLFKKCRQETAIRITQIQNFKFKFEKQVFLCHVLFCQNKRMEGGREGDGEVLLHV